MNLADKMRATAHESKTRLDRERAERVARENRAREQKIDEAAKKFFRDRAEHLLVLIEEAAKKGLFEWKVWVIHPKSTDESAAEQRGLSLVRAWLQKQGFKTDWHEVKEDVLDYGHVHNITLTAKW